MGVEMPLGDQLDARDQMFNRIGISLRVGNVKMNTADISNGAEVTDLNTFSCPLQRYIESYAPSLFARVRIGR